MSGIISSFEKNKDFLLKIYDIYGKNFLHSPWSKEYFLNFFNQVKRKPIGFYVEDNGHIAGFVLGRKSGDNKNFNLSTLWVDEKYRGLGYGRMLMEKIIQTIEKGKISPIIIVHFRKANDLKNFYAKGGFSRHKIVGMYSNGDKKYQMELLLKNK